ncbi:MAG: signal peptidase I [Pseudomonadota bacterium]|nr:signal peptidase I [Pseudomonadota bacterium]
MNTIHHPRKPLFALAMSLVLPGFGQLYNGEPNKAIWLFLCFALLNIPGMALVALYLPGAWMMPALVASLLLTLLVWLYGMVDAWRSAGHKQEYQLLGWQLSGIYLLILLLCNALALPLLINYVRQHQVESFRIPSSSMEPSVLRGDILFADKRYNCPNCNTGVERGDVAIFVYPNNRTLNYIKRVIALPGDSVRIAGRSVWVNDTPLTVEEITGAAGILVTEAIDGRQWQVQWTQTDPQASDMVLTVPPGHAFVLGDNRDASQDSRTFGTVPLRDIVGKARQVWFSSASEGVRWGRFGKVID